MAATIIAAVATCIVPASAWGHAQLIDSSPTRGETVPTAPELIELEFSEPVEASFGALRLYDSAGRQVETGDPERPEGRQEALAVRLPVDLADGAYTATFRVVSADSHPVSGGFIFSVGRQEAPTLTVAELLEGEGDSGVVTDVAAAAARVVSYLALAAMVGGLAFLLFVWRPVGLPSTTERAFLGLTRRTLTLAGLVLTFSAVAGILFQGALASGAGIPHALDIDVVGEVLGTRYGETALIRALAGLAFTALAHWSLGETKLSIPLLVTCGVVAAATFGLGGHAGTASPLWLTVPASLVHVLAMAAWFGGLAMLLWAIPRTTRQLPVERRTGLLAVLVSRFSLLAIVAVGLLLLSGIVQSVVHLDEVAELWQSGFGRAILVKAALFSVLIAIGWYNRRRLQPRLIAASKTGSPPGHAGRALRTALRAEVVLALAVLTVSAVLVSLAPAASTGAIFTATASTGPIEVEMVLDPPRVGPQEVHIYLFDGATGQQWDEIEEITLTASEGEQEIGPLPIEMQRVGPGHYVASGNLIAPPGEWRLDLDIRASEFETYPASFEVRVR